MPASRKIFSRILTAIFLSLAAFAVAAQDAAPDAGAAALIDILEDDAKRAALLERLKSAAETPPAPPAEEPVSLGRSIAETTKAAAERGFESLQAAWAQIARAPEAFNGLSAAQVDTLTDALKALALVIVITTAVYVALGFWARRLFRSIGESTQDAGFGRTFIMLLATTLMDAFIVLLAWGAGYVAALFFYGEAGVIGVRQSLYLNAFLIAGLVKVAIRAVLSPATGDLRFISLSDVAARRLARWLGVVASVLAYGQLLIVPIVNRQASVEAGRGASTVLALVAILIVAWLAVRWRRDAAAWLIGEDAENKSGIASFAARNWHVPVLIYLIALFLIVAARPDGLILPLLANSAQVLAVVVGGFVAAGAINRAIGRGVRVPGGVSARLPALERRLSAALPRFLWAARALIVAGVVLFALDAVDLIDMAAWLSGDFGGRAASALASIAGILVFGFLVWLALVSWVDFRLNPDYGSTPTAREQTLLSLLKNAVTIVLIVIIGMFVLSELGVDIAPLIASAGVLGLAIGFGAQKLVQDLITGVFIQFENAMNVGDVVTLGGTTGVVEKLTIRSVSLRDVHGAFHIIPFSSVDLVSNFNKDYGNFVCDMGIAYRENVDDGKDAMHAAFEELRAGPLGAHIIDDLQWFGVQTLGDSAVVLRARIKCAPGQQWAVGRAYNEICKRIMDERGIEIPFPHQTIYFGADKNGEAPPLRVVRPEEG